MRKSGEKYLNEYIVKNGDTLLSIAKNQLGDSSRVNEIITLNKEKYPTLSLENSFIEIGWKFLLPPKSYGVTNGLIFIVHGTLYYGMPYWGISLNPTSVKDSYVDISEIQPDDVQKFSNLGLSSGDCVTIVYQEIDYKINHSRKVLEVLKQ